MDLISVIVTAAVSIIGALGGGSLLFARHERKQRETSNKANEVALVDEILHKYEISVLNKMDENNNVRIDEFRSLKEEVIKNTNVTSEIVEYLNGGFAEFEAKKRRNEQRKASKRNISERL